MDLVVEFLRHNSMMNRRLLDACRLLSTEQLAASTRGTYGGIGATLVHIANSQEGYAARLLGAERPEPLPEDPLPGFDALAERFAHGDAQLEVRKSTRLNSSHVKISYAVFCLKKKKQ